MNNELNVNKMVRTYAVKGDAELQMKIYTPKDWTPQDQRAAIIFFFGGGWEFGTMDHFRPQSEYLASKGMVAITPDYRVKSRQGASPFDCVEDGMDAVAWVQQHAQELGIDPNQIAVGGGSAGGHIAACTALLKPKKAESNISMPHALVLFNPVLDTTHKGFGYERLGDRALELSPVHHVKEGLPPTILFHGTDDNVVPFENAQRFQRLMEDKGNQCILYSYQGKGHGFFNPDRGQEDFWDTLRKAEEFLRQGTVLCRKKELD